MEQIIIQSAILIAGLAVLSLSSEFVVTSSVKLSKIYRIREMVVGVVFIAFATSIPELAVSVNAILNGAAGVSIGNLIGSNIADIALVVGISALLAPLVIRRDLLRNISSILLITSLFPLVLISVPGASRVIGLVLVAVFFIYVVDSLKARRPISALNRVDTTTVAKAKQVALLIFGLAGVIISSKFVVSSAVEIATALGIAQSVIGATIIAVGTSLPELAVCVKATMRGRYDLAVGNALGSCITNIGFILGLVLLVAPFTVNMFVFSDLVAFLITTNLIMWYFVVSRKISRLQGVTLLLVYVTFLIATFFATEFAAIV